MGDLAPSATSTTAEEGSTKKSSGFAFLDSLVPSYLSVDVDGRVIRLDTFSKMIAPGCRLGWITAQPPLIERLLRITETSTQQPSGFVQSMVAELIMGPQSKEDPGLGGGKGGKGWEVAGWVRWLEGLRGNYERRMQAMSSILEDGSVMLLNDATPDSTIASHELDSDSEWISIRKQQIYTFNKPMGGMFLWLTMFYETHPLADRVPGPRLSEALFSFWTTRPYLVLVAPGTIFSPSKEIVERDGWKHFRLCFAACKDDEVEAISRRMVQGAHAFWNIRDVKQIDKLIDDMRDESSLASLVDGMGVLGGPC